MINTSQELVFLKSGDDLKDSVMRSLSRLCKYLDARDRVSTNSGAKGKFIWNQRREYRRAFQFTFAPKLIIRREINKGAIEGFFNLSSKDLRFKNISASPALKISKVLKKTYSTEAFPHIISGARMLLIALWSERAILLPISFRSIGVAANIQFIDSVESEVVQLFRHCTSNKDLIKAEMSNPLKLALETYVPRLIWTTNWHKFKDVNLDDLSFAHVCHAKARRGECIYSRSPFPFTTIAKALLIYATDNVTFNEEDLSNYVRWSLGREITKSSFREFCANFLKIYADREARYRKNGNAAKAIARKIKKENNKDTSEQFKELCKSNDEGMIEAYYAEFRGNAATRPKNWLQHQAPYPGRELAIDLPEAAKLWRMPLEAWLIYRKVRKGYEEEKPVFNSLNILFDYLFLYLPWWIEIHPSADIKLPTSPKDFLRSIFVSRLGQGNNKKELPKTFIEMLEKRTEKAASQYGVLCHIEGYFDFISTAYGDNPDIWNSSQRNPIQRIFDFPRSKKSKKTNKIPFTSEVYPFLIRYAYAVESFGMFLQDAAAKSDIFSNCSLREAAIYNTADFGLTPIVAVHGKCYPLSWAPNVYPVFKRNMIISEPSGSNSMRQVYMLHLGIVRMLITAIETGLRLQHIQWLDVDSFDEGNKDKLEHPLTYFYDLTVNTDKVKKNSWNKLIQYRVRNMLLRERNFRNCIAGNEVNEAVWYEGRENSVFGQIRPLFLGYDAGKPWADKTYSKIWVRLLEGFEGFYNSVSSSKQYVSFIKIKRMVNTDGTAKIVESQGHAVYSPLSVTAINTPHACRATFATLRDGYLDVSEIAQQLGHQNPLVTSLYIKPNKEALLAKLIKTDLDLAKDEYWMSMVNAEDSVACISHDANIAIAKSFQQDRLGTELRYGFTSVSLITQEDISDKSEGLAVLRSTPMSQITFSNTHICPVGSTCPPEVLEEIYESKRCGLCKLAVNHIDNLPAITAKQHILLVRIRDNKRHQKLLEKRNSPMATIDEVWSQIGLDTKAYLGWKLREEVLVQKLNAIQAGHNGKDMIHVEAPEIVKLQLQHVVRECPESEFYLRAIAESNAWPTMQTPEIRAIADKFRRKILANAGMVDELVADIEPGTEVEVFCNFVKHMIKAKGFNLDALIKSGLLEDKPLPQNGKSKGLFLLPKKPEKLLKK